MPTAHAFTVRDEPPRPEPARYSSGDVVDKLPPAGRAKLQQFRDRRADEHAALVSATDRLKEARDRRDDWKGRLAALESTERSGSGFSKNETAGPDHPAHQQATAELKRAEIDVERLSEIVSQRSDSWQSIARTVDAIESYLETIGTAPVQPFPGAGEVKHKGSVVEAIEGKRRRCRELQADRHRVLSAPRPSEWCKQKAKEQIEALARRGCPDTLGLLEIGEDIRWPTTLGHINVRDGGNGIAGVAIVNQFDAPALLAWLDPDRLYDRLAQEIDAMADDGAALSDEQRAAKLSEISRDRLATEREIEALHEQAERQGMSLMRDPASDPRAVLGLADSAPAPRET